jgi:hypothetical protein
MGFQEVLAIPENGPVIRKFLLGSLILWAIPFAVLFFVRDFLYPMFLLPEGLNVYQQRARADTPAIICAVLSCILVMAGYVVMALREPDERLQQQSTPSMGNQKKKGNAVPSSATSAQSNKEKNKGQQSSNKKKNHAQQNHNKKKN